MVQHTLKVQTAISSVLNKECTLSEVSTTYTYCRSYPALERGKSNIQFEMRQDSKVLEKLVYKRPDKVTPDFKIAQGPLQLLVVFSST